MKNKQLNNKLSLRKKTVSNLNNDDMNLMLGGATVTCHLSPYCAPTTGCPFTQTCPSDCRTC